MTAWGPGRLLPLLARPHVLRSSANRSAQRQGCFAQRGAGWGAICDRQLCQRKLPAWLVLQRGKPGIYWGARNDVSQVVAKPTPAVPCLSSVRLLCPLCTGACTAVSTLPSRKLPAPHQCSWFCLRCTDGRFRYTWLRNLIALGIIWRQRAHA